jgi:DNA-binding MarR family transcriptional regulator
MGDNVHIDDDQHADRIQDFVRGPLKSLLGIDDTSGVEIFSLIHAISRNYMHNREWHSHGLRRAELSRPRWGMLMLLMAHERLGRRRGMSPTEFSRFQGVSRNTVSSLLRGLEDQGYVRRSLDPDDYRMFSIELTDTGRKLIQELAPEAVDQMNDLASGLTAEERTQLIALLEKLRNSIRDHQDPDRTMSSDD